MSKVKICWWLVGSALVLLLLKYSDSAFGALQMLVSTLNPLLVGIAIAYVLNIIVVRFESLPPFSDENAPLYRFRRLISVLASLAVIALIVVLLVSIVFPQLAEAVKVIASGVPALLSDASRWLSSSDVYVPQLETWLSNLNVDWPKIMESAATYLGTGFGNVFSAAIDVLASVGGFVVHLAIGLIFALYLLTGKEKLARQFRSLAVAYLPERAHAKLFEVLATAHQTFSTFFVGQFVEALIIGALCTVGMLVLQFPYATMIGAVVGATALVPVVGAYIGAILGAFMIMTVSPLQAVGFVVFIVILQQLEGNLIYPRVVGSSVGLPGLWVLLAVTLGGGLGGVVGMLLAVPLAATAYKLLAKDVSRRLADSDETDDAEASVHDCPSESVSLSKAD